MNINFKYDIGDIVYLITDNEQNKRIVTGYHISFKQILYRLSCGTSETSHYEIEISSEKSIF